VNLRQSFDSAANLYHGARPGYPEALFDDLASLAGLHPGARVLEVGAGTGIATLPLAQRGYRVTALEPGPHLAIEARRNLEAYPQVEVAESTIEAWNGDGGSFDLALAATSWHWVEQPRGYERLSELLAPNGVFAMFEHIHVGTPADRNFFIDVQPVYIEHAPGMWLNEPMPDAATYPDSSAALLESGVFSHVDVRRYRWDETYSAERYVRILRTFSGHITLPEDQREALFAGVQRRIEERYGGSITKGYLVILHVAHR
jgi:SAM-dependent methyltransferase